MGSKRDFFRRTGKTLIVVILICSSFISLSADQVHSDDLHLEPWLLLEKGKNLFRERDFATALNYFHYALEEGAVYPEVEYWIGRVYEEEGEFLLAEEQYKRAYEQRRFLYIRDQQYEIAYRLAQLYYHRQRWNEYEDILLGLIEEERQSNTQVLEQEHSLIRVLKEEGLDQLLYLYRRDFSHSLPALVQLGEYYYLNGQSRSALLYNMYSVMAQFSQAVEGIRDIHGEFQFPRDMDQLRQWDPLSMAEIMEEQIRVFDGDFSFPREDLSENIENQDEMLERGLAYLESKGRPFLFSPILYTLEKTQVRPQIGTYLEEQQFFRSLYYLGMSLYSEGYPQEAGRIWYVLSEWDPAGHWSEMAKEELDVEGMDPIDLLAIQE